MKRLIIGLVFILSLCLVQTAQADQLSELKAQMKAMQEQMEIMQKKIEKLEAETVDHPVDEYAMIYLLIQYS